VAVEKFGKAPGLLRPEEMEAAWDYAALCMLRKEEGESEG
jgi:hypothetical protein